MSPSRERNLSRFDDLDLGWSHLHRPDVAIVRRFKRIGRVCALLGLALAVCIALTWIIGVRWLSPTIPTWSSPRIGSLASLIVLESMLLLIYRRQRSWTAWVTVPVLLFALGILFTYLFAVLPGIRSSAAVFHLLESSDTVPPNSAFCLLCGSAALLLYHRPSRRRTQVAQLLCLMTAFITVLAFVGYAYTVESLYGIGNFSVMTLPGAIGYFLLSMALLLYKVDSGVLRVTTTQSSAGVMSRRLYAAVALVPPILGFLALMGSTAGDWYDLSFAIALLVVASMILFAIIVAVTSLRLEHADSSRLRAEEHLTESREELRRLSAYIQVMQEQERLRIAREVHDELGQALTALKMDVVLLRNKIPLSEEGEQRTSAMLELVNSTIKTVQRISTELRPSVLDDLGIAAAVEWQAKEFERRSGIRCSTHISLTSSVNEQCSIALFRILQETLTNIARHAHAKSAFIWLTEGRDALTLEVRDDGVGSRMSDFSAGTSLGIMGMRERAKLLGGDFVIQSDLAGGTTVTVTIPIERTLEPVEVTEAEAKQQLER